jgi:PKD repeat protein
MNGINRDSKEGDPGYRSATDLTIAPTSKQLSNWGAATTGITTDYEGDIRNPLTPDVGADEYSDLYDLGVSAILSPSTGCERTSVEQVQILVKNLGNKTVPTGELIPVSYIIGSGTEVNDTFILSSALLSNATIAFTFATRANLTAYTAYQLKTWTDLPNDSTRNNDTAYATIHSYEFPQAAFTVSGACTGEDITFTDGSTITSSAISNWKWTFGNGKTSTLTNPKTQYSTSGVYSVKLVVTAASGCKDSTTTSITLNTKPLASLTVSKLCHGDSTTFTNTSSIATATGASFLWDFDNGSTSTRRHPKHTFASTGTYDVVLVSTSSEGCADTAISAVVISAQPTASFSSVFTCKGDSTHFTNTSTIPLGFTPSYAWSFGDGNTSTSANPAYLYGAIGNYTVMLTASLTNGCSSQATRPQGVFSKPQPAFATANVCLGDSAVFTNSSVIQLDTIDTYTWTFGDGNGSSQAQPKYLYATTGTFQVKLVIESVKGCRDSLGKTVEVYDKPATSISVSTVCEGVVTTFDHSTSIASGSLTAYAWVFGDGFTSSAQSPTHLYDTANTYPVSFVVYSNNGCTDTALANAVVNVNPEVDFDVSNVCFGSTLYPVNNTAISSGSISSYAWDFGDGNTSAAQHPFHKYLTKDTFEVRLIATSNLGCKDSMTIPVIVDSKLAPNYIVTEKCLGDSTLFQNTTNISCGSVTSYYWDFGDGNNSARENPRHKYASAGTYNVKLVVYQQGGVKDSITKQVVAHPYPSSNFTASNTCAGKQMSFTNNSSIGSGSISSYQWDFGDGNKSSQSAPSHTYATHGAYDVRLVSTSNFGCKDTLTKRLDIYELPKSSFSVSNACLGSSVSFSNNSSISSGSLSYAWSFGDGFSSTQTSPNYTYASAGTYTVTLTATSGSGCSSISSKQVTIHPRPVPGFSAGNQCANVAISFNNSSTISSGTLSYLWRFGDKTNSTAVNPNHLYASPGSYSVTLVATSNKGCVDSAKKSVSALPTPIANFTVPSACGGTTVNYANGSSVPSGSMTHLWYFGDGKTSTLTSPTHIYSSTGTYTVKLVSTASSGCKDSVEKTVKVYDLPTASFTVSGKCLNDSILFTNNSSIASGLLTYKWSLGDGSTSTRKQISHLYSAIGTYPVKLVAYSSGGCNDSSTQSVSVYYSPSAAFSAPDACLGQGITFSNTSSIPSGSLSYLWDFDNGSASTLASPTHTYATTGSYDVLLIATSNNGCGERLTKTVEVHPNPVAGFTHAKTCLGDTTVFLNSSTIASGTLSYLWDFGDGNKTSSNNPSNTYSATGTYNINLTATSAQGCSDTESKKLYINPVSNTRFVADNTCEGQPMAFDNKTTLSSGSYVSTWKLGDGNTSVATDPIHRYINPGSYTVVLTTTTDSGCVSKYKVVRVVHHKPTAGFTSANTCLADSASFVDQSSVAAGKVMGHIWQFGDGFGHNTMNPKHLYQNFGTYLISQIVRTDSGCTDTATMNIQVYPMPQAGFTAGNVCFGDTLYPLNTSSIATGSIGGYAWDFGDGNSSTATSPFNYYMAKGKYDISLVATSDKGCRDTATTSITVDNVVVPGFTFSNVCVGSQVSFTNTTNASCGKVSSYQWSFGDGNISSQLSPSHLYTKAGSYNVQLVVTEKSGRKDTLIKTVVIYPNPQVAFAAHDTCAQSVVRVKNKSTITSGSIGNYTWHMGDGNKYSGLVPSHAYTSPGPYTIKLVATSNHGCTDSLEYTGLDIHYLPQVKFSYIADCEYNSVQFSNGSAITAGTLAYAWDLGDMTTSTSKAPTHSYPAGNYTVRLTATSNLGCVATISRGLWVSPAPIAKALADSVCQGLENQFTNLTSLASGSIASYDWAFGDGFTATQAQPTHTYNIAGFYKATLITVSDSGCRDTAYTSAGVWPRPTIDFDVSNICLGDDFTPTNRSAISTGSITGWKWDFGDGNQSTVKSPTHTYLAKGSYAVKLVATSDKSCADSSSKSILVDNVIRAGFAVSNVCLGDTARFTNTSSTSCGTVTGYVWHFGDGGTSTDQHPTYKYKTDGTYTVRLIVLQQGGNRDTFDQNVVVYPKPVTGFSATDGCQGTAVSFTNNSSISGGGPMNYVWSMGNGYKTTSSSPIYTYGAPATYRVVLQATSDKGCVDSTAKNLAQYAMPVAAFAADTVCEGTAITFTNSTTIASGTISYLWSFGDGFSSTQTSPIYLYAQAGNYSVQLKATSDKGCADLAVHTIRVLDMPHASFAIYDTCATSQLRVNNLSTISSGSMTHFWDLGDGTKQIGAKPKHGYASPGMYWVKLVSISDKGCADSLTSLATIFENPIAAIGYTATCPDQAVSFTHNSTPTGSIATVLWDFGLGNTSTANNPSHTYGNSGTATAWLKVSTLNNCWDTAKKVIQFESVPLASFSWPSISCQRDSVVFTNQTTLKQGTATYLWRFGSEGTSTDMQGKYAFDSAGAYDVTLVATSNAGCMDSLTQTIALLDKPEPAFEFTGGCLGDTTYFEATSGPGALKGAKWRLGDGNTNNSLLGTKHLYANTGIYEVVYTTWNDNCADSAAKTIDLAVGPKNLDFEFANTCAREKVQFINLTSNGNLSYKWLFFDGSSSNLREPVKYYGKAGKFPIGFIAWEGDCVDSAYKVIEIYPYPDSSFGFIQQAGAKFKFIPKHLGDASYYWDFGDGNTSVLQEPRYTYASNGTYLVKLTVLSENFCASVYERSVSVNVYTSLGQTDGAENMISLYPNPFDRAVRATLEMAKEGRVRMTVINELGQQVGTAWEGNLLAGTHDIPLIDNAETLRAGMYFVQVEMGNQSSMLKLILAR